MPRTTALSLAAVLAASPALGQVHETACAPRVEASSSVPLSIVARVSEALAADRALVHGQCPVVRFDTAGTRLEMTVVLDDGRTVVRALPSPNDALPTLVALTAGPSVPVAPDAPAPPPPLPPPAPPEAPRVEEQVAPPPAPPPQPVVVPGPTLTVVTPLRRPARRWQLRVGASFGAERWTGSPAMTTGLDIDVLFPRWAFGVRGAYGVAPADGNSDNRGGLEIPAGSTSRSSITRGSWQRDSTSHIATLTLSARRRWTSRRWQFELGPAISARMGNQSDAVSWIAGAEASLGLRLVSRLSVFARLQGGFTLGSHDHGDGEERVGEPEGFDAGAALGLRWEVW